MWGALEGVGRADFRERQGSVGIPASPKCLPANWLVGGTRQRLFERMT